MTKGTVVIIDDEPYIRQVISRKLERAGYEVHTARDGAEGLELISTVKPCLLITAFKMPICNGLEVCASCREDPQTAGLPIIVLTGSTAATGGLQSEVKAFGNVSCMSNPFSPRELLKKVDEVVEPGVAGK